MDENTHSGNDHTPWPRLKHALWQATAVLGMAGSTLSAQTAPSQPVPPAAPAVAADEIHVPGATCFDGQIDGPQAERIKRAVVMIGVLSRNEKGEESLEWIGSGFIVSNSATPGHPENKIVTAAHVIAPLPERGVIRVESSDGIEFGTATVLKTNWGGESYIDDNAALAITGFNDETTRKNFTARQGLEIGPQSKSEYRTGPFGKPAGLTTGISGGPVLNSAGQVIGLAQSRFLYGQVSVQAPEFGETVFDPKTHKPKTTDFKMDAPSPGFVTAITPGVLEALGPAGRHIRRHDEISAMEVRALGAPMGACLVVDGQIRKLDFKTLDDFRERNPVPPEARYAHWDDPTLAMPHLIELMEEARTALPQDKRAAFYAESLKKYKEVEKVPALDDLSNSIADMAAALKDTPLTDRLNDANEFISTIALREMYRDPKLPFAKRAASALKHTF